MKIRGHRVELAEVEAALLRIEGCRDGVVTAHNNSGEDAYLLGYFVPTGDPPTVSSIRAHLAAELPAYMIPRRFIIMDVLPRQANGKIDLCNLPEPIEDRPSLDTPFVAPRDALEGEIAELAEEILGVGTPGVHDDFLDLGCDSLKTLEFLAAVQQRLNKEVSVPAFFQKPTIAGLARAVRKNGSPSAAGCIIPIHPEGSRPPLFCMPGFDGQAGNWLHLARLLGPDQPVYALRAPKLEGTRPSQQTLSAIAAHLAAEIRLNVTADQVIHLFGYSLGGTVAYECARQLSMLGQALGPLILSRPAGLRRIPAGLAIPAESD